MALHRNEAGERIAEARESAGMTQQDAADAVGVDRRTIQRYEAGDVGRMATVSKLAEVYGLTVEQMLGDGQLAPPRSRVTERLTRMEAKLDALLDHAGIDPVRPTNGRNDD